MPLNVFVAEITVLIAQPTQGIIEMQQCIIWTNISVQMRSQTSKMSWADCQNGTTTSMLLSIGTTRLHIPIMNTYPKCITNKHVL